MRCGSGICKLIEPSGRTLSARWEERSEECPLPVRILGVMGARPSGTDRKGRAWSYLPWLFAVLIGVYIVVLRLVSPGTPEMGDGILHWQYARYAVGHPELFFDHWGKPLFTLLAAPFAQPGLWGTCVFAVLCAVFTSALIDRSLVQGDGVIRSLAPVLLFTTPVYLETVFAGMTEVLFAALAVTSTTFALLGRSRDAAMVGSFLPYSRPEWMVYLPILVVWMILRGRWAGLPWLLLGSLAYAVAGAVVLGDPGWYFKGQLYLDPIGIYGRGEWDHFLRLADHTFGVPLLTVLGLSVLFFVTGRELRARWELPFLTLLPALGVFVAHSYAWWSGGHASFGLERVMATVVPLLVLFITKVFAAVVRRPSHPVKLPGRMLVPAMCIGAGLWSFTSVQDRVRLPLNKSAQEEMNERIGHEMMRHLTPDRRLVYTHPYFAWFAGRDPFDTTEALRPWQFQWDRDDLGLSGSDVLIWDSHFSANEGGLLLPRLLSDSAFRCLALEVPPDDVPTLGGWDYELFLFDRGGANRTVQIDTLYNLGRMGPWMPSFVKWDAGSPAAPPYRIGADEAPFAGEQLPVGADGILFDLLRVEGAIAAFAPSDPPLSVVITEENAAGRYRYYQLEIEGPVFGFSMRFPRRGPANNVRIRLWDRQRQVREFLSFRLIRERWYQQERSASPLTR